MWPFCKGMAAGLIVGTTLAMVFAPKKHRRCGFLRHNAGKILKGAGSVIDNLQSIL